MKRSFGSFLRSDGAAGGSDTTTRLASLVLMLLVALPAQPVLALGDELQELIAEYEAAKEGETARGAARGRGAGRRRGGGGFGRGGARPAVARPELASILARIAGLGTPASLNFLAGEYGNAAPEIAAQCAVALLGSGHEAAVNVVARGFDRRGGWSSGIKARVLDALVTEKSGAGREFVLRSATRGSVESRALAMGSLALRLEEPEVRTLFLESLGDRATALRRLALRMLEPLRAKDVVSRLIARLGQERDEYLRVDVLEHLVKLTGKNMGLYVEDWKKWWEVAEPVFEFEGGSSHKTAVTTRGLSYFGIEVASNRVSFLVDTSGSMGQPPAGRGRGGKTKMDLLKEELSRILGELSEDTSVNLIAFHGRPVPWKEELHPLKGRGRAEAISFVQNLPQGGGTNVYDSLELALADQRVDTMFLLSDGRPSTGKYTAPELILREIGALNRLRGVTINCIGFGDDTELLEDLAAQSGGVYRSADGKEEEAAAEQEGTDSEAEEKATGEAAEGDKGQPEGSGKEDATGAPGADGAGSTEPRRRPLPGRFR
jgi:hypothetical protein